MEVFRFIGYVRLIIKMKNIIIDVDTGIDDALAIILAAKLCKEDVLGITVCGGNVKLEEATENTLRIAGLIGWNVPVYAGASKSITGSEFVHAYDYHGTNGICDVSLPAPTGSKANEEASDFIARMARERKVNIICLAAPTNIARAIAKNPKVAENIEKIYLMGGAFNVPGNQTEYAEYNFFQDPKAVETILQNAKDVYIVPLDVTNRCLVSDSSLKNLGQGAVIRFVSEAVENWYRFFGYPKKRSFELYDPLTLAAAVTGEYLSFKEDMVGIHVSGLREGEVFSGGKYAARVAFDISADKFNKAFFSLLE